jgi:tetratricopeptide (TPR) repeat protein
LSYLAGPLTPISGGLRILRMLPPRDSTGELGSRLESWKEIAAYLNRDVRTVQRWEKAEGLPVHRHVHEALASIYAYTAELDAWRANRASPAPVEEVTSPNTHPVWFRPFWGIGVVLALALVASGSHRSGPALHFQERDWVMLEGFENRTGEALFEGTLRAAMERELSNSEFISVAPRERVEDALRLMQQPSDTVLTAAQAREVCLRDGGIRALVTGRTEKVGSTYLVSAEVIDPVQNRTLASDTEAAPGQDQIWPAVRKLSNWVREILGETMERIDRSNRQLEKVTTPSLRALQLFTEADSASRRAQWAVSAQLTRQALVEDPEFASARMWLAWALKNLGDPDWKLEAKRALDLSDRVSERERYFIQGSNELLSGHAERALPAFEALVRRYPDHYFAYANLENIYNLLGRPAESAEIAARFADARPNDPVANSRAVSTIMAVDLARARRYAQRATELASSEGVPPLQQLGVTFFRFHDLWMQDDVQGALAEIHRISGRIKDSSDPEIRRAITITIAGLQLTLGRFKDSQQVFDSLDNPAPRWSALVAFFEGDEERARQSAALIGPNPQGGYQGIDGFLIASLWPPGAGKKLIGENDPLARGEIALQQGRFAEAAAVLQREFHDRYSKHAFTSQWIADGLVTALEQTGDSQKALEVLKATSGTRMWTPPSAVGYQGFWLRNQARLSAYYLRLGRQQEARKIDDQLRKLLAVADPDHPILRQLSVQQARRF